MWKTPTVNNDINKRKRKDWHILGFFLRAEKVAGHEDDGDTNTCQCAWNGPHGAWRKDWRKWRSEVEL